MIRLNSSICVALSVCLFAGSPGVQAAEIAKYDDGPFAGNGRPYSESARVGELLFLTGQTGEDKDGNLVPGGIKAEAEQMMLNIKAALRHVSEPYPARTAVGSSGLLANARVEMECMAGYPK